MPKCANCGTELDEGAKFCLECGTPVPQNKKCINCGFELPLSAKFCPECGTRQDGQSNSNADGSGFSMGDKNVIAGDVIGHKEETHIAGNATIIKNEDETKKTARCHICGSIVQIIDGFDCPECHQFTCSSCYDEKEGCCTECAKTKSEQKINRYKEALKMVYADGRIEGSERRELIDLQSTLGISSNEAAKLEEEIKKSIQGNEPEITTVEKISIDKAKEYFYKDGNVREALNLLEPIYNSHKNAEMVLNIYLPALAETAPLEAQDIISALQFDILTSFIVSIKTFIKQNNLVEAEKKLTQATRIWHESSLLKCYQVLFNLAMYKQWKSEKFLQKAKETADNLGEPKDQLELSYQVKVQAMVKEACGEITPDFSRDFCEQNGLYFYIMDNNPILTREENQKEKEIKEKQREEKLQEEKRRIEKEKEAEVKALREEARKNKLQSLQDDILKNPKEHDLNELLDVEAEFHDSQIQFWICRYYEKEKDWNNSFYWAEKSAAQNNADGIARLGSHYLNGNGCDKDEQKAYELAKKSADQESSWGYNALGFIYGYGYCGMNKNTEEAIKLYKLSAEQGNEVAQCNLGMMYKTGEGVTQDYELAVKWLKLSAEQGNAIAQNTLGQMYENGESVPQDYEQAVKWFKLAAEQGNTYGQSNLGFMYFNGRGIQQNYTEALKWFTLSAEQNNYNACAMLGLMYKGGHGTSKDYAKAFKWYKIAAERGHVVAQQALGEMYESGTGVTKNYEEAIKWYKLAAEQENAQAQNNLGHMYQWGIGVPPNNEEAVKWYKLAAEQGNAYGQSNLGYMYQYGAGVTQNYEEAVKWYKLAAEQGNAFAQKKLGDKYEEETEVKQIIMKLKREDKKDGIKERVRQAIWNQRIKHLC